MAAAAMALTFASLTSLRLLKRASCGTAFISSESRNAGVTNTSSPTPSCLFSLSPFLSSPQQGEALHTDNDGHGSKGLRMQAYGNPTKRERAEGSGCSCVDRLVDD
ncbi:hypothetical protein LguiA_007671 [Lonicera macranthoides]